MISLKQGGWLLFTTIDSSNLCPSTENHTITATGVLYFIAFVPENLYFVSSQCITSLSVSGKRGHFSLHCTEWLEWHLSNHIFVVIIFYIESLLSRTLPLSYHLSRHEGLFLILWHRGVSEIHTSEHLNFQYISRRPILNTSPAIIAMMYHIFPVCTSLLLVLCR